MRIALRDPVVNLNCSSASGLLRLRPEFVPAPRDVDDPVEFVVADLVHLALTRNGYHTQIRGIGARSASSRQPSISGILVLVITKQNHSSRTICRVSFPLLCSIKARNISWQSSDNQTCHPLPRSSAYLAKTSSLRSILQFSLLS